MNRRAALLITGLTCFMGLLPIATTAAPITNIYYATGDSLRVVDFDGTSFTSFATILEPLAPDWTGMSLAFAPSPPSSSVPEPTPLALLGLGLLGLAGRRRLRRNE